MHRCLPVEESVNDSFNQKKERRKMKIKKKHLSAAIAFALMLTIAATLMTCLPTANAQEISVPDRPTGNYLSVRPPLLGINQELTVNIAIYPSPNGPRGEMGTHIDHMDTGGMHFWNVSVTFTKPDGSKDTFMPTSGSDFFTRYVGGVPYKTYFEPG